MSWTQILEALRKFIREFQDDPYAFLYKEDVRAALFPEIRKHIPGEVTYMDASMCAR